MAMRQSNLDLFIHPVKKACTEVDQEASLYKCNLCHITFKGTQGLGSHMATAHREKDKAAGKGTQILSEKGFACTFLDFGTLLTISHICSLKHGK